jgi:hypothetical protein
MKLGPYIFLQTYKGLGQGDSLSPLLFDVLGDAFAIIMRINGSVKGVFTEELENGLNMM